MPKRKILIVDDDPSLREMMVDFLDVDDRFKDCLVYTAPNGVKGMQLFETKGRFDLVITDLGMPGGNGQEFITNIQRVCPDQTILIVSSDDTKRRAAEARFQVKALAKPFDSVGTFNATVFRLIVQEQTVTK